jgi:HNH endonuclease
MTLPVPEYRTIELTQGQVTIVDAADYDWLNAFPWHAKWNHSTKSFYAMRRIEPKSNQRVRMQNVILGLAPRCGLFGDHINGNTLDNRRENLRVATQSQNNMNRKRFSNNTSGHPGVAFHKGHGRWVAYIQVNHVRRTLGESADLAEAIRMRKAAEGEFGEFLRAAHA